MIAKLAGGVGRKSEHAVSPEELQAILARDPQASKSFDFTALYHPTRKRLSEDERRRRRVESNRLSAERSREKRKLMQNGLEATFNTLLDENAQLRQFHGSLQTDVDSLRSIVASNPATQQMYLARRKTMPPPFAPHPMPGAKPGMIGGMIPPTGAGAATAAASFMNFHTAEAQAQAAAGKSQVIGGPDAANKQRSSPISPAGSAAAAGGGTKANVKSPGQAKNAGSAGRGGGGHAGMNTNANTAAGFMNRPLNTPNIDLVNLEQTAPTSSRNTLSSPGMVGDELDLFPSLEER